MDGEQEMAGRIVRWWLHVHQWSWPKRLALKGFILALTWFAVCYPRPGLLLKHIEHWRDPNRMIEPDSPHIDPLVEELVIPVGSNGLRDDKQTLLAVQRLVYKKLPYAFDWETWGVVDYFPTVDEAMTLGREDCDGRAVVGASLLARLGFTPRLVVDGAHVWVWTPEGETMSPGRVATVQATPEGFKVNWRGLWTFPRVVAVGLALFPLGREVIITFVLWLLILQPVMARNRMMTLGMLLLIALLLLREGGGDYRGGGMGAIWCGIVALGFVLHRALVDSWAQIKKHDG